MVVYKFGGASVKDSDGVQNLMNIILKCKDNLVIVVSAFGKTTNALEEILKLSFDNTKSAECGEKFRQLKQYHRNILDDLFQEKGQEIYKEIEMEFDNLYSIVFETRYDSFDFKYDQVVSVGEVLSTKIVSAYINSKQLNCKWADIRKVIITDNTYREAKINMQKTESRAKGVFTFNDTKIYLTQGFIGGTEEGHSTTLGREGSDYTAAILANLLNAEKVIVWKDVEGVLNADPKYFTETKKLNEISYQEAVELAYFGAKVIHPKTIKPLHNKNIPLFVKSFINHDDKGTVIKSVEKYVQDFPVFILKKEQMLISLFPKDLSFVIEDELSSIFNYLSEHRIKVNLIQNSAISISFCIDNANKKTKQLIEKLRGDYKVLYNDHLELLTIRHYSEQAIQKVTKGRKIYIEQRSRHTAHFVIK